MAKSPRVQSIFTGFGTRNGFNPLGMIGRVVWQQPPGQTDRLVANHAQLQTHPTLAEEGDVFQSQCCDEFFKALGVLLYGVEAQLFRSIAEVAIYDYGAQDPLWVLGDSPERY